MINEIISNFYQSYLLKAVNNPITLAATVLDLIIVFLIFYKAFSILKGTRAWQLLKGIIILIICTYISGFLKLTILNYLLSSLMSYGVILLIIVFQPEIRRSLEQLGTANKFNRFIGLDKDINAKTKESVYRIAIAAVELAKQKKGALIVIERDIRLTDIISNGILMNSEVSPQLLVNIFEPNTPLHDGAVVISENKIASAACMLPLADDTNIARELGTRHRAAIGMSIESDALVVVVSEETGKISIAKEGTLIADLREDVLKKILIKNLINEPIRPSKLKKVEDVVEEK